MGTGIEESIDAAANPEQDTGSDPALFPTRLDAIVADQGSVGTVIDVGAHVGALTLPALARGATVVAVEPCLVHMMALTIQAADVGAGVLLPVAAAIWDVGGQLFPLYGRVAGDKRADPGQMGLLPWRQSAILGWTVTVTLEELMQHLQIPEVDLLKMDVEGAEHRIIPALPLSTLRRFRYVDLDNRDIRNDDFFEQRFARWADLDAVLADAGFALQACGLWKRMGH